MKDESKQAVRASEFVANKLRHYIDVLRQLVATRYGLDPQVVEIALARGAGLAVVELTAKANTAAVELGITPSSHVDATLQPTTEITNQPAAAH